MSAEAADAAPDRARDRHPEIDAPIVELSLETRIARAEQTLVDRDGRIRSAAIAIAESLRASRGTVVRGAAMAGMAGLAIAGGCVGYRAWCKRKARRAAGGEDAPRKRGAFAFREAAALVRQAVEWLLRMHAEQDAAGSLFGMIRKTLWPSEPACVAPPKAPGDVLRKSATPVPAQSGVRAQSPNPHGFR